MDDERTTLGYESEELHSLQHLAISPKIPHHRIGTSPGPHLGNLARHTYWLS